MNEEKVVEVLHNFLDRIEKNGDGRWKLDGPVTPRELEALKAACRFLGGAYVDSLTPSDNAPVKAPAESPYILKSLALKLKKPESPEVTLCLDFGTARSKAFATSGESEEPLDLLIGRRAGQANPLRSLNSSAYITKSGTIFFGHTAMLKSQLPEEMGTSTRLDSIKKIIIEYPKETDLAATRVSPDANPSDTPLARQDLLTLYLAYLTDMAASELQAEHGKSRYVRRRFTMPVFDSERLPWAKQTLGHHFAEAILVADELHGQWSEGIPLAHANRIVAAARNRRDDVAILVDTSIVEPVAAFGSRTRDVGKKDRRFLMTVVDVGAGTTDFATFAVIETALLPFKMTLVTGSVHYTQLAGDFIDKLLAKFILQREGISSANTSHEDIAVIQARLNLTIRDYKEALFRDKRLDYDLSNGASGSITLAEFRAEVSVQKFGEDMRKAFDKSFALVNPAVLTEFGKSSVTLMFTGGGSTLPMIDELKNRHINGINASVYCTGGGAIPAWVHNEIPDLELEYPQMAVAIGGASREVPHLTGNELNTFLDLSGDVKWTLDGFRSGV